MQLQSVFRLFPALNTHIMRCAEKLFQSFLNISGGWAGSLDLLSNLLVPFASCVKSSVPAKAPSPPSQQVFQLCVCLQKILSASMGK